MIVHIFGKSSGCSKCTALKRKVAAILEKHPDIKCQFHDLLTEDGIVKLCHVNVNPNRVPAIVLSDDDGQWVAADIGMSAAMHDKSILYPYKGVCTDYSDDGHRGVITPSMIEQLLGLECMQE